MSATKRLFLALDATSLMDSNFAQLVKKLRKGADVQEISLKWTPTENLHVTVVFIGDMTEDKIPQIIQSITPITDSFQQFSLKADDVSAFPTEYAGRAVYVGVQAKKNLHNLHTLMSEKLVADGILQSSQHEHDYVPHLTIARLRNPQHVKNFLSPLKGKRFGVLEIKDVVLYESKQQGVYPVYLPIHRFSLAGIPG